MVDKIINHKNTVVRELTQKEFVRDGAVLGGVIGSAFGGIVAGLVISDKWWVGSLSGAAIGASSVAMIFFLAGVLDRHFVQTHVREMVPNSLSDFWNGSSRGGEQTSEAPVASEENLKEIIISA